MFSQLSHTINLAIFKSAIKNRFVFFGKKISRSVFNPTLKISNKKSLSMKKKFLFVAAIFTLASCSLQKQTTNTSKTLDIYGSGVIQKPVLTNLKVNPNKFTSTYSGSSSQGIEYHKSQAISKAMIEKNADVIIEPAYEITSSASTVSIIITGYAGNYENFRQLTGADTSLLVDAGIINYNNGSGDTPAPQPVKKKGKAALIILAILVAAGSVANSVL